MEPCGVEPSSHNGSDADGRHDGGWPVSSTEDPVVVGEDTGVGDVGTGDVAAGDVAAGDAAAGDVAAGDVVAAEPMAPPIVGATGIPMVRGGAAATTPGAAMAVLGTARKGEEMLPSAAVGGGSRG